MESKIDSMTEELNSVTNPVEKNMLLQKYGLIEPKLTQDEQFLIADEITGRWEAAS